MRADILDLPAVKPLRISTVFGVRESFVTSETVFASPRVRALHVWWAGQAARGLPRRATFDVTEHRGLVPNLSLVEALTDGSFRFKLNGEAVIEMFGVNSTGRVVADDVDPDAYGHALHEYYSAIVATRQCRHCLGGLAHFDKGHIRFESLDCPLSQDGSRIDAIIGVVDRIA